PERTSVSAIQSKREAQGVEKSGAHEKKPQVARAWRRFFILVSLMLLPGLVQLAVDFSRRHEQILHFGRRNGATYAWWAVLGVTLWGALVYLAMARGTWLKWWARLLLLAGAALALGGQTYIFSRYGAYLDHRAALVGTSMMPSIGQQL